MLFNLVRPLKRSGSTKHQFVKRIPNDLRKRMVGRKLAIPIGDETAFVTITAAMDTIRCSLRTSIPSEVRQRQAEAAAYVEAIFESVREDKPLALTHRQVVALSGRLYRSWAADLERSTTIALIQSEDGGFERDYDSLGPDEMEAAYEAITARLSGQRKASHEDLERLLGPIADRLLADEGIAGVEDETRRMLLPELLKALVEGMEVRRRKAGGDYSPDPSAERFPEFERPNAADRSPKNTSSVSLQGLVEGWWREAKEGGLSESTHASYLRAITVLGEFLEQDDATRITTENIISFKDHLLAPSRSLSAKTIKDSYLAGLHSVFAWAVANRKLAINPAHGVTLKVAKPKRLRDKWFSRDEAGAILSASTNVRREPKEPPQRHALKRWVPWLCAYTGARVGEIVQLRREDVRKEPEGWVVTITPEAGTVKDKQRRDVPLHAHLIDLGFIDFVKAAPQGHLFLWSGTDRAAWRTAKNHLTRFVRNSASDMRIQPNHAWRHTFKTIGSEAGVQDKVLDAICGHAPRTVGEGYGGVTLKAKARAMEMYPRYRLA